MMKSKITKPLIGGVILATLVLAGCIQQGLPKETKELKLSDLPEAFRENTLIVVGDNASEIEMQAANEIAEYLEEKTGNKPLVKRYSEIAEEDKRNYNLIVVGTPKTNPLLEEVYAMTNATRVTEEFPGEGKGILEILPNPWDEEKAMLLVEGSDEWGVKAGSETLKGNLKLKVNLLVINWQQIIEIKNNITRYLAKKGERLYRIIYFTKIEGGWHLELYTTKNIGTQHPYPREQIFYGHIVEISDKGEILMDRVVYTGHEILIPIPRGGE